MVQTSTGFRMDHRAGGFSDRAMALAMASLFATVSPSISPAAVESWRSLIADMRSPGGAASRLGDVTGVPGMPNFGLDQLDRL
jgi:hypothetical protein